MAGRIYTPTHIRCIGDVGVCNKYIAAARAAAGIGYAANTTLGADQAHVFKKQLGDAGVRVVTQLTVAGDRIIYIIVPGGGCEFDEAGIFTYIELVDEVTNEPYFQRFRWDNEEFKFFPIDSSVMPDASRYSFMVMGSADIEFNDFRISNTNYGSVNSDTDEFVRTTDGTTQFYNLEYLTNAPYGDYYTAFGYFREPVAPGSSVACYGVEMSPHENASVENEQFYVGNRIVNQTASQDPNVSVEPIWDADKVIGTLWVNDMKMLVVLDETDYENIPYPSTLVLSFNEYGFDICGDLIATEPRKYPLEIDISRYEGFSTGPESQDLNMLSLKTTQRIDWNTDTNLFSWTAIKGVFIYRQQIVKVEDDPNYHYWAEAQMRVRATVIRTLELTVTKNTGIGAEDEPYIFTYEQVHAGDTRLGQITPNVSADFPNYTYSKSANISGEDRYHDLDGDTHTFDGSFIRSTSQSPYSTVGKEYVLVAGYYKGELNLVKAQFNSTFSGFTSSSNQSEHGYYDGGGPPFSSTTTDRTLNASFSTGYNDLIHVTVFDNYDTILNLDIVKQNGPLTQTYSLSESYYNDGGTPEATNNDSYNSSFSAPDTTSVSVKFAMMDPALRRYSYDYIEQLYRYSESSNASGTVTFTSGDYGDPFGSGTQSITDINTFKFYTTLMEEGVRADDATKLSEYVVDESETSSANLYTHGLTWSDVNEGTGYYCPIGGSSLPNYSCTSTYEEDKSDSCDNEFDPDPLCLVTYSGTMNESYNYNAVYRGFPCSNYQNWGINDNCKPDNPDAGDVYGLVRDTNWRLDIGNKYLESEIRQNVITMEAYNNPLRDNAPPFRYGYLPYGNQEQYFTLTDYDMDLGRFWVGTPTTQIEPDDEDLAGVDSFATFIRASAQSTNGDTLMSMFREIEETRDAFLFINGVKYPFNTGADMEALGLLTTEEPEVLSERFWGY